MNLVSKLILISSCLTNISLFYYLKVNIEKELTSMIINKLIKYYEQPLFNSQEKDQTLFKNFENAELELIFQNFF